MSQLTLRLVKGEELTFSEIDANFLSLDSDIMRIDSLFGVTKENLDSDITAIKEDMDSFHTQFDSLIGILQGTVLMDSVRVIQIIDSYVDSSYFEQYGDVINNLIDSSTVINLLGDNLVGGLTIDSVAPDANEGEMWLDVNDDQVYIYDGDAWFEFPGAGDQPYASLQIGDSRPSDPGMGTLFLDNTTDVVKIYDGHVWFDWPYPEMRGVDSDLTNLQDNIDSEHAWNVSEHSGLQNNIDSVYSVALAHYEFDSVPVQAMIDSALSLIDGGTY